MSWWNPFAKKMLLKRINRECVRLLNGFVNVYLLFNGKKCNFKSSDKICNFVKPYF
jgi:hypothetical protein